MGSTARAGVLLLAFGGPSSLDEVGPFMERLMGRPPTPEMVASAVAKYELIGGCSPLPGIVSEQAALVADRLGEATRVYVGMRYSSPTIADAVMTAQEDGCTKLVAVSLSPHYSAVSTGAYREALAAACDANDFEGEVILVESWATHSAFLDALAERFEEARAAAGAAVLTWPVVFTAHSLPTSDPGVRRYVAELQETVAGVAARAGLQAWDLAYQSKGRAPGEWLGPLLEEVLGELAVEGSPGVVVAPAGFTCEHMETLYDLDIAARGEAERLGLGFVRVPTVGAHPRFIQALAEVAEAHLVGGRHHEAA